LISIKISFINNNNIIIIYIYIKDISID